jgi:hypothetical protein
MTEKATEKKCGAKHSVQALSMADPHGNPRIIVDGCDLPKGHGGPHKHLIGHDREKPVYTIWGE